jgi:hypothetical protein
LEKLRAMVADSKPSFDKFYKRVQDQVKIEDLALDFTLPGYDNIELRVGVTIVFSRRRLTSIFSLGVEISS